MVKGQGCPSTIENVWESQPSRILKMSYLIIFTTVICLKFVRNIIDPHFRKFQWVWSGNDGNHVNILVNIMQTTLSIKD